MNSRETVREYDRWGALLMKRRHSSVRQIPMANNSAKLLVATPTGAARSITWSLFRNMTAPGLDWEREPSV